MQANATPDTKQFYLQDSRGNVGDNLMFWANGGGYTSDLSNAELFSEDSAFNQNQSRPTDVPWPAAYLGTRTRPVVDMQYIKRAETHGFADSKEFYLQSPGHDYVGNDILFLSKDGKKYTTNLNDAKVLSLEEAFIGNVQRMDGTLWPKAYIDAKSRPAVDYRVVKLAEALKLATRTLTVAKPVRRQPYRCQECGRFMSEHDYYCAPCSGCGCENRP